MTNENNHLAALKCNGAKHISQLQNRSFYLARAARNSAVVATVLAGSLVANDHAHAQTAGDVMSKMSSEESATFVAGMIEGIATSRWMKDQPDATGMKCIYDWYYKDSETSKRQMFEWFDRHPDQPPGALLYVLVSRTCGE